MSPVSSAALLTTNSFNVNVLDLIKKNLKNLRVETAIQYGALTSVNPQGSAAGEVIQMYAEEVEGQKSGFCAFSEKLRAGVVVRDLSSYKQKVSSGTWGFILKQNFAIATMIGL